MNVEDYGVPAYDELVIVANRDEIHAAKIRKFLRRCRKASLTCALIRRRPGRRLPPRIPS
jgi:hypothetical protein